MGLKIANDATSTLSGAITDTQTTLSVQGGHGARFPTLAAGDFFYATIISVGGAIEIVKVTARSADLFTIVRGQEGKTAIAFASGSYIANHITAKTITDLYGPGNPQLQGLTSVAGTGDAITATSSLGILSYALGQDFFFVAAASNTGATTINIDGLGAVSIQTLGQALQAGDIVSGDLVHIARHGSVFELISPRAAIRASEAILQTRTAGFVSVSVAGAVDVTASTSEADTAIIELTGAITANIGFILPATPRRRWLISNQTTGAFTVTAKTAAGTGVVVTQGLSTYVRNDGTNVVIDASELRATRLQTSGSSAIGDDSADVQTVRGTVDVEDNLNVKKRAQELAAAVAGVSLDLATTNFFHKTISGATAFTFANPPASGSVQFFTLELTNAGAFATTFPATVKWAYGVTPTFTTSGVDIISFYTRDGGTTYRAGILTDSR